MQERLTLEGKKTTEFPAWKIGEPVPQSLPSGDPVPDDVVLEVITSSGKRRIPLRFIAAQLLVGRGDDDNPVELDMTSFDALDAGVSRRHAALLRRTDGVFVEDLGSTNGTYINGFLLKPNRAYLLRNGDEIEFGRLRTVIRFLR